ncbi:MAG: hypothetical protein HYU36_10980 [Planctomycetes bacterium]|nr:hypothetical protein [Planctomycetota bacterium]
MPNPVLSSPTCAPERLLIGFSRSRVAACLGLALLLHVLVIGGTSSAYIRDRWIDPEGALERKRQAEAARKAALKKAAGPETTAKPGPASPGPESASTTIRPDEASVPVPAGPQASTAAAKQPENAGDKTDAQLLEEKKNAPVVKRITEAAKPEEIPRNPDDLGISIEETNGH